MLAQPPAAYEILQIICLLPCMGMHITEEMRSLRVHSLCWRCIPPASDSRGKAADAKCGASDIKVIKIVPCAGRLLSVFIKSYRHLTFRTVNCDLSMLQ